MGFQLVWSILVLLVWGAWRETCRDACRDSGRSGGKIHHRRKEPVKIVPRNHVARPGDEDRFVRSGGIAKGENATKALARFPYVEPPLER